LWNDTYPTNFKYPIINLGFFFPLLLYFILFYFKILICGAFKFQVFHTYVTMFHFHSLRKLPIIDIIESHGLWHKNISLPWEFEYGIRVMEESSISLKRDVCMLFIYCKTLSSSKMMIDSSSNVYLFGCKLAKLHLKETLQEAKKRWKKKKEM